MAKTKQQKQEAVDKLAEGVSGAISVVFANFQGLSVAAMEKLRANCREANVKPQTSKKTLVRLALAKQGIEADTKAYEGGVAVFLGQDEVSAPKVVADFAKDHEEVIIFGGVLEGAYVDAAQVNALAKLPTREELLSRLVGSFNSPISGFVNVLAGNMRGLVTVLSAIKDQKA